MEKICWKTHSVVRIDRFSIQKEVNLNIRLCWKRCFKDYNEDSFCSFSSWSQMWNTWDGGRIHLVREQCLADMLLSEHNCSTGMLDELLLPLQLSALFPTCWTSITCWKVPFALSKERVFQKSEILKVPGTAGAALCQHQNDTSQDLTWSSCPFLQWSVVY